MSGDEIIAVVLHPDTARCMTGIQRAALHAIGVRVMEDARVPVGHKVEITRAMLEERERARRVK